MSIDTDVFHLETLSRENWHLFEELMGEKGGCGGCWCMSFRLPTKEFIRNKFEGNKNLIKELVDSGKPTGVIAISNGQPVAWAALAPREDFVKIEKSRTLKRIDDKPVWSLPCFYIRKEFRRKGISKWLVKSIIELAKENNITALEAYPVIPYSEKMPDAFLWIGSLSAFTENGFKVVRKNGATKMVVRLEL